MESQDSARYVLRRTKLNLRLKTLAVCLVGLAPKSQSPLPISHSDFFFLFLLVICEKEKNCRPTLIVEDEDWTEVVILIRAISEI